MARSRNAQMLQLSLAASKTSGDFTESIGAAQLTKHMVTNWPQQVLWEDGLELTM